MKEKTKKLARVLGRTAVVIATTIFLTMSLKPTSFFEFIILLAFLVVTLSVWWLDEELIFEKVEEIEKRLENVKKLHEQRKTSDVSPEQETEQA